MASIIEEMRTLNREIKNAEEMCEEMKKYRKQLRKDRSSELKEIADTYTEIISALFKEIKELGIEIVVDTPRSAYYYSVAKCNSDIIEEDVRILIHGF